ncbi:MAG: hypothetical protein D6725_00885 [Planctomycetota bacterium]|nr:MAG: hypothetical protein D6725_00885 [Planctomycetota bacterium]
MLFGDVSFRSPGLVRIVVGVAATVLIAQVIGCGRTPNGSPPEHSQAATQASADAKDGATSSAAAPAEVASEPPSPDTNATTSDSSTVRPPRRTLRPVQLGAFPGVSPATPAHAAGASKSEPDEDPQSTGASDRTDRIIAALRPLQVLLGEWRGLTARSFGGFKAIDQPSWVWDLTTDPGQPALVMQSDESPYFRHLRLTYLPQNETYFLSMRDADGKVRTFRGTFVEPPRDVPGDDRKLQRTFKLKLTEVGEGPAGERWQLVFNQQENNRCLIEISRARGSGAFRRMDTVALQRKGTSFALSDTDYGEKTCVISQGLGTIAVSYKGRTYWVCCTGCKAAFEEDPERWIARFERLRNKAAQ